MRAIEERGLPANLDAERFVLGSVLNNGDRFQELALSVEPEDFSLNPNRLIWDAMAELDSRGIRCDIVTVAEEFRRKAMLESIGGLSYLIGLDDGIPQIDNLASYAVILREKRLLRKVISVARGIEEAAVLGQDSASELIGRADVMVRALGMQTERSRAFLTPNEIIREAGGIGPYMDPAKLPAISTGFPKVDEMTNGGIKPGDLWVFAGYTGDGKSTFTSQVLHNMANAGTPVGFASLEMSSREVTDGLICRAGAINTQRLRQWFDRGAVRQAVNDVAAMPFYILDRPGLTIPKLQIELRRLRAEFGICVAGVDYLQLMTPVGNFGSRAEAVSSLTRGLKLMAMELHIGIVALSQLSRPADKTIKLRPRLADLKESSSIEQDANLVGMVFGERQEQKMEWYPWEFLIEKQRGGPVGRIDLAWRKSTGTFTEAKS